MLQSSYMLQFIYSSTWKGDDKNRQIKKIKKQTPLCDTHAKAHNAYEKLRERWKCIKLLWFSFLTYKHQVKDTRDFIFKKSLRAKPLKFTKEIKIYETAANANSKALSSKLICVYSHGMIKNWQKYVHKISNSLIPFLNPHTRI